MNIDPGQAFVIAVIIIIILYYGYNRAKFTITNTTTIRSDIDGQIYRIHREHADDGVSAADMLAKINRRNIKLLRHLKKNILRAEMRQMNAPNQLGDFCAIITRITSSRIVRRI